VGNNIQNNNERIKWNSTKWINYWASEFKACGDYYWMRDLIKQMLKEYKLRIK